MFKVAELLKAARGRLISRRLDTDVSAVSIDTRTIKPGEAFIAIKGANFNGHNFIGEAIKRGAKVIITQNSKLATCKNKASFILVKDTIEALGRIAKFQRKKFNIPVIAVTGSNGKTTAKEMIAQVLSQKFKVLKNEGTKNNQIGLPKTLLNLNISQRAAVLEIGTNHPGEVKYLAGVARPNIGIITNIGQSHLETFKDLKGIFKEKITLIKHLKSPQIAILNADDNLLKETMKVKNRKQVIFGFGIKNRSDFFASDIKIIDGRIEFLINQKHRVILNTLGYYNVYNALAAVACARIFGIDYIDISARLSAFNFPQSRLQLLELNNIKFIDDTYNSNPLSLRQALDALDKFCIRGRKIFVMGDMLELGAQERLFHHQAGRLAGRICDVFITVGSRSKFAGYSAKLCGFDAGKIFSCRSNLEARDILFNKVFPGPDDVVLVKGSRAMRMEEILKF